MAKIRFAGKAISTSEKSTNTQNLQSESALAHRGTPEHAEEHSESDASSFGYYHTCSC